MTFDEDAQEEQDRAAAALQSQLNKRKQVPSCLEDIAERIAEAKKSETENKTISDDDIPLRDRTFTKEELLKLEKKKWIEIKDLIFETDTAVLDYLSWHCRRWRKSQAGELEKDIPKLALAKKNTFKSGGSSFVFQTSVKGVNQRSISVPHNNGGSQTQQ